MADTDRPQDVGRQHRRKRSVHPEDVALMDRYLRTMRLEMTDLLDQLQPVPQDQGLGMVKVPDKRPPLADRTKIWDLAIKLAKELGSSMDDDPLLADGPPAPPRRSKRGRPDFT